MFALRQSRSDGHSTCDEKQKPRQCEVQRRDERSEPLAKRISRKAAGQKPSSLTKLGGAYLRALSQLPPLLVLGKAQGRLKSLAH